MYMSRNDKNVMTSTNFDKTLKAISLFCLEHKGFNIKFYACAYVYLFLKYIYKHFLMAQLECRRWSTTLVENSPGLTPLNANTAGIVSYNINNPVIGDY